MLVPYLVACTDQGLAFDVAVHFGSLLAVVVFFLDDIAGLLRGGLQVVSGDTIGQSVPFAFHLDITKVSHGLLNSVDSQVNGIQVGSQALCQRGLTGRRQASKDVKRWCCQSRDLRFAMSVASAIIEVRSPRLAGTT